MISGARQALSSPLRRLVARAAARDLRAFVVPGPDIARASGVDLEASGLSLAETPRHSSVLVLVGELPASLKKAAAVAYAQMPRPRAILAVGAGDVSPLPEPDVSVPLAQEELADGVVALRSAFAEGAFSVTAENFDVDEIHTQTEYVCPMHPDVISDEPGSCPKCGMDLVPREATGSAEQDPDGHGAAGHGTMDYSGHGTMGHERPDHDVEERPGQDEAQGTGGGAATGYTCPMHWEVASTGPGSCPICGMDLVPRASASGTEPSGAGAEEGGTYGTEAITEDHERGEDSAESAPDYTCPMHPDVSRDTPGSCPVCGMNLELRGDPASTGGQGHTPSETGHGFHERPGSGGLGDGGAGRGEDGAEGEECEDVERGDHDDHGGMDHGDMGFMSMVEMTQGTPRSSDGLQMEWVEAPFGPLFPGLPGGLRLTLTLDGDTVAEATGDGLGARTAEDLSVPYGTFADRLATLDPLAPVAYRLLATRAVESATGLAADEQETLARVGSLEKERAASHLGWLADFARLLGYQWLESRAARLQLALLRAASAEDAVRLRSEVGGLARRVERTPLLERKLRGLGSLPSDTETVGPVARADGARDDARSGEAVYRDLLGFEPAVRGGGDALSRLLVRLDEARGSLELIEKAGSVSPPVLGDIGGAYGAGAATVETSRGAAALQVTLGGGTVQDLGLETPSGKHLGLVEAVAVGEELANALIGVGSLDLSPWGAAR